MVAIRLTGVVTVSKGDDYGSMDGEASEGDPLTTTRGITHVVNEHTKTTLKYLPYNLTWHNECLICEYIYMI